MKNLVVAVHPHIENSRVNKTWLQAIKPYTEHITVHELYRVYPHGKITDVPREQALLETHDNIIFQFPLYWFSSPSLLKQWFDDVFTHGWAYGSKGGKLRGKGMGLAISMGGTEEDYRQRASLEEILTPFRMTAFFVGMKMHPCFSLFGCNYPSDEELAESARQYLGYLQNLE